VFKMEELFKKIKEEGTPGKPPTEA